MDLIYLPLASQVPTTLSACPWYKELATIERELRQGQAADILSNLRDALQLKELLLVGKAKGASGNKSQTRAQGYINKSTAHVNHFAKAYNSCRQAMVQLGMKDDDPSFPRLKATDIYIKAVTGWKATGEGKVTNSWIWTHGLIDKDAAEWKDDSELVHGNPNKLTILTSYSISSPVFSEQT